MKKTLVVILSLTIILLSGAFVFRGHILTAYAQFCYRNDTISTTHDIVVLLGGNLENRLPVVVRLYQDKLAGRIVLTELPEYNELYREYLPSRTRVAEHILQQMYHIPRPAYTVVTFRGEPVTSTYEEAVGVKEYAASTNARSVIIVTDEFHSARSYRVFRDVLPESIHLSVKACPNNLYNATNWWKNEEGLTNYILEPIKLFNYYINRDNRLHIEKH